MLIGSTICDIFIEYFKNNGIEVWNNMLTKEQVGPTVHLKAWTGVQAPKIITERLIQNEIFKDTKRTQLSTSN